MTDTKPTPPDRPEPHLDPTHDTDEPAFDWMKPAAAKPAEDAADPTVGATAADGPKSTKDAGGATAAGAAAAPPSTGTPASQPESRADRKAAEAAVVRPGAGEAGAEQPGVGQPEFGRTEFERSGASAYARQETDSDEPLQTSALQIRPPQEDVERRNAQREQAAKAKPVLPRVMQVLLAVFYPIILLVLAVRAVTSPLFLWVEYNRPGFPGDGYGFSTDDRMTYGSYAVDYLSNWSGPRYLGGLVDQTGERLFKDGEVSHMADVKTVILSTFGAGTLLILLAVIAVIYLARRHKGGVRRGLFAGSIVTLAIIIGLGTLAFLGWEQFFTDFHRIFFANGTWTFSLQDTLIRLFPGQFWVDAGIVIGGLVLLASLITLVLTWPTRRRRGLGKKKAAASKDADESAEGEAAVADGAVDSAAGGTGDPLRARHTV